MRHDTVPLCLAAKLGASRRIRREINTDPLVTSTAFLPGDRIMFLEWNSDRKPQKKGEVAWHFPELLVLGIRGS
jgi:hypothetical protein